MERGVIVATDSHMEWLLPWWWERYSCCNSLPVVFVDLGMSLDVKAWCQERGEVITLEEKVFVKEKSSEWGNCYGESYSQARQAWFKKPLACLKSPFQETVWMDLDCEILSSIEPIYQFLKEGKEVAAALDPLGFISDEIPSAFNGGVLVFRKDSLIIQKWASLCLQESDQYWGDDRILSSVIHELQEKVAILPPMYNWRVSEGVPFYAKIIHWCGEWGKAYIVTHGGLKESLQRFPALQEIFESK